MTSFGISAPGKIILFGEHAVVYGHTAIAASLDLRTRLYFTELLTENDSENYIYIDMPKIKLTLKIPLSQINNYFFSNEQLIFNEQDKLHQTIKKFIGSFNHLTETQKVSLECLFMSLLQTVHQENLEIRPFRLQIDTSLSIGAGSGSSASFSVCLSACFLYWNLLQKNNNSENLNFDNETLKIISGNAFNCEKIIHGTPSGIDNSICTYGSFIEFEKNKKIENIKFKFKGLRILLVNTKVERSTKKLVEQLANLRNKYDGVINCILDSMGEISRSAIQVLNNINDNSNDNNLEFYNELMLLIELNQGLLSTCQLSHTSLDKIVEIAKKHDLRAKLTGAGGGGYAYILIPPNISNNKIEELSSELLGNGFSVVETGLGGPGVEITRHKHQD